MFRLFTIISGFIFFSSCLSAQLVTLNGFIKDFRTGDNIQYASIFK